MIAVRALAQQSRGFSSLINSMLYPLTVVVMGLIVAVFVKHSGLPVLQQSNRLINGLRMVKSFIKLLLSLKVGGG